MAKLPFRQFYTWQVIKYRGVPWRLELCTWNYQNQMSEPFSIFGWQSRLENESAKKSYNFSTKQTGGVSLTRYYGEVFSHVKKCKPAFKPSNNSCCINKQKTYLCSQQWLLQTEKSLTTRTTRADFCSLTQYPLVCIRQCQNNIEEKRTRESDNLRQL